MIKEIYYEEGLVIACDGKVFKVYGNSPVARSIRNLVGSKESPFREIYNTRHKDENWSPVGYWVRSASYMFGKTVEYTKDNLQKAFSRAGITEKEQNI